MELSEIRPRLLTLLDQHDALQEAPEVWRQLALYCCRLTSRTEIRRWIYHSFKGRHDLRDALLELKDCLDHNDVPNRVLRAVYDLAEFQRRHSHHYEEVAARHHLLLLDLRALERSLTVAERTEVRTRWPRGIGPTLGTAEVALVVKRYTKVNHNLVKRYLSYVYRNNTVVSFRDLCNDLAVETTRLVKHYEVYLPNYYSTEHLYRCVHRGLLNKVKNLAKLYSRQSRRSMDRIHRADACRDVWHLDPTTLVITPLVVSAKLEARRLTANGLETRALKGRKARWVCIADLYASEREAEQARFARRCGDCPERPMISLAPSDLDDFRLTNRSLDAPLNADSGGANLYNYLSLPANSADPTFLMDLSKAGASKALQDFARIVIGDYSDQVFSKWLHTQRRTDVGTLTLEQLGQHAARWVGTTLAQIRKDLAATSTTLWRPEERAVLNHYLDTSEE